MDLSNLKPPAGARKKRKRIGRGKASGWGKTAAKGHKGQKARSGNGRRPGFEGGQMPLQRRIPKRGFNNKFRKEYAIVNLDKLNEFEPNSEIDSEILLKKKIISKLLNGVKILGNGELDKPLKLKVKKCSESAKSKIEAAGGSVEII